ncbi:hypothetical protein ACIBEA_15120 [Streptomyces sp. NPDC051555]|uniref:hypothetical protein n=1 Tax=Streptomyces sp. NPDC051555 TaxID=3365657 RepID=UPI0037880136
MKTRTIAAAIVTMGLMAAGTTGCGTDVTDKAASAAVAAALAEASQQASKPGSADITTTVSGPKTGGRTVRTTGLYSWGNGRGISMQNEMPAADVKMEKFVADGTVTVRLVDAVYYYNIDPVPEGPFKGKTWVRIDASAILGEAGASAMKSGDGDPMAGLKTLTYAKNASKVGTETLRGKKTTHYRATVPTDRMGAAGDAYTGMGMTGDLVTDVWLDDKGTPSRLSQSVGGTDLSIDFLSFGGSRTVEAPPAADTVDFTDQVKKKPAGTA